MLTTDLKSEIVSVLPGQGVSVLCQSPTHYRVMTHVMTCYLSYLCDIDQRPGMVAKMDSRKHENVVNRQSRKQSDPDTPFIDSQSR